MNLLELTQQVAFRSRSVKTPTQIGVVTGLTGRSLTCLDNVRWAWREIQTSRPNWNWMRRSFSGMILSGDDAYASGDFSLTRWRSWRFDPNAPRQMDSGWSIYLNSEGVSDERPLTFIPYDQFRPRFLRGEQDNDYPQIVSVDPEGNVRLGPKPDADYTLDGEYMLGLQTLDVATDTPEMPETFHELIVLEALVLLNNGDENAFLDPRTRQQARVMRQELERQELPEMRFGSPLA